MNSGSASWVEAEKKLDKSGRAGERDKGIGVQSRMRLNYEVSPIKCDVRECVVRTSDSLENLTF